MSETVTLPWEWILGIIFTLIIAFLGWLLKQFYDFKNETEQRLRFLENENSSKTTQIGLIEKITLGNFEKKEKKKNA